MVFFIIVFLLNFGVKAEANILNNLLTSEPNICYASSELEGSWPSIVAASFSNTTLEKINDTDFLYNVKNSIIGMENKLCTSKRQKLSRIIELHKELENSNTSETEKLKKISLDLKLNLDEFKKFLAFFETQYNNLQKQLKKKEKQILALQPNVVGEVTAFHEKIAFMLEKQFNEDLKASRFLFYSLNLRMKAVLAVAEGKATAEEFAHANIGKPIKSDNELQKDAMFIEDNIPAEAPVARKNFWEKVIEKFYIIVSKFSG